MLSQVFLGMSLIGAEWVLYLLVLLSIISVTVIFERVRYYSSASRELGEFRSRVRELVASGKLSDAEQAAQSRMKAESRNSLDLETEMAYQVLNHVKNGTKPSAEVLGEIARDAVVRTKIGWDRNLAILGTIANIAPFVGLFGTVLGIIKAFHDLSQQAAGAANTVTAGISEALVATAVGILVAIPASVGFNLFQRKVKAAMAEAEALKSFLIGKLAE